MRATKPRSDVTAGESAATEVVTASPTDTLAEAGRLMAEHDSSHLVVPAGRELLAVEDGYRESTDSRALREPFGLLRAGAGVAGGPTVETPEPVRWFLRMRIRPRGRETVPAMRTHAPAMTFRRPCRRVRSRESSHQIGARDDPEQLIRLDDGQPVHATLELLARQPV